MTTQAEYSRRSYYKNLEANRERAKAKSQEARSKNRDKINVRRRQLRLEDPLFLEKERERLRIWRLKNPGVAAKNSRASRLAIVRETFVAYGGKCACCGETNLVFLTIDHVYGNGTQHRKEIFGDRKAGIHMYRWLKKQGFPKEGYQVLCFNCNLGRQRNGGSCPHVG